MNGKTYAYNGIVVGVLLGILADAYTNSVVISVVVAIAASVVCFLLIRLLENLIVKGVDKASDMVAGKYIEYKQQNTAQSENLADRFQPSDNTQNVPPQNIAYCTKCGAVIKPGSAFCVRCGAKTN